jgi:hypothetical protein
MPLFRRIVGIIVVIYLLLVIVDVEKGFVLIEVLVRRVGVQLLLAAVEALAIVGAGFVARRWRESDVALDFVIGYPIFGAICFLAGLVNVSAISMTALVVIFAVAGTYAIARRRPEAVGPAGQRPAVPIALLALIAACAFIAAQAPPSTLDELAYHLAVPWSWVKEHHVIDLPLISHSYFPLGIESADLPFLSLLGTDGALASHFLHLGAAIATTVLIFRRTRDLLLTTAIVATPALAITAGWSLVDWPLVGIAVALIGALDDDDDATLAAALGAGLLTKYTFVAIAVIALLAARYRRVRPILIGVAIGSLFFIRNLIVTGNPVAPFFSATAPHVAGYRGPAYLSSYVFDGFYLDESLGASLIAACAMTTGALGWLMLAAGIVLFTLAPSARILVPFLAIAASRAQIAGSRVLRVLLVIAIVVQTLMIAFLTDRSEAFSLVAARSSDEEYLRKARLSIPVIRDLDATLPRDSVTLVIGLNETFWFSHRVRGGGNFDGPRMSAYLTMPTPEALHARLKHDGITHVAIITVPSATNVSKKLEERDTELTPEAKRITAMMLDRYAADVSAPGGHAALFALR